MTAVTLVHLSDLHFGRDADLAQIRAIAALMPSLAPDVICVSGDLTQRARHGEFQAALLFFDRLQAVAPTIALPGNHDVQWWESPFHLFGAERLYAKYRRWFGREGRHEGRDRPDLRQIGVAAEMQVREVNEGDCRHQVARTV